MESRIKKVERITKGQYRIIRNDNTYNYVWDEVEAKTVAEARTAWYEQQLNHAENKRKEEQKNAYTDLEKILAGLYVYQSKSQPKPVVAIRYPRVGNNTLNVRRMLVELGWRNTGSEGYEDPSYLQPEAANE